MLTDEVELFIRKALEFCVFLDGLVRIHLWLKGSSQIEPLFYNGYRMIFVRFIETVSLVRQAESNH